jgi:hypothetical protein
LGKKIFKIELNAIYLVWRKSNTILIEMSLFVVGNNLLIKKSTLLKKVSKEKLLHARFFIY